MNIRKYEPSDYKYVKAWWLARRDIAPPEDMIPRTTYVVEKDGVPISIRSVFLTNHRLAFMENNCRDPEISKEESFEASKMILDYVYSLCRSAGLDQVFTMPDNEKIMASYIKHGFEKMPGDYKFLLRRI